VLFPTFPTNCHFPFNTRRYAQTDGYAVKVAESSLLKPPVQDRALNNGLDALYAGNAGTGDV
jgi:hypothetical protein